MKAVLLSPGPSLARLEALPECAVSVGVNRAATAFPVSIWACSDYPLIRDWRAKVKGTPRLFTKRQTWLDIQHRGWFDAAMVMEDVEFPVKGWLDKTATAALALLYTLGAERISVYGADMAGMEDWDKGMTGEDRTPLRWEKEKRVWDAMVDWMSAQGVEVNRYGLSG